MQEFATARHCCKILDGMILDGSSSLSPSLIDPATLARQHGAAVFRAAYRVLGDRALAEDVQQDVFLRLLETPPGAVDSWPAYLAAAATRAAIDLLRRQRRWWRLSPVWRQQQPDAADSAEQTNLEREQARRLRAAIATLSPREAQCFGLRYLQGLEIGEIAHHLQLSPNTVSVSLHRARQRLEARLGSAVTEVEG